MTLRARRCSGACQFGNRQQGHERKDRDDGYVLGQKDKETGLAARALQQALLGQGLQHDRSRGERQHETDCNRHVPGLPQHVGQTRHGGRRQQQLATAQPKHLESHLPQVSRLQLEPDEKQHQDNAQFGNLLDRMHVDIEQCQNRTDHDARDEVAENRAHSESRGDGDRNDAGDQKNERKKKDVGHAIKLQGSGHAEKAKARSAGRILRDSCPGQIFLLS